jgi:hypothetical protein
MDEVLEHSAGGQSAINLMVAPSGANTSGSSKIVANPSPEQRAKDYAKMSESVHQKGSLKN